MNKENLKQKLIIKNVDFSSTINKLSNIVKMGYVPQRGFEQYSIQSCRLVNCFEHACFNLTNSQLSIFDKNDQNAFVLDMDLSNDNLIIKSMMGFVRATGLEIEPCLPKVNLKSNQWQVAFYLTEPCDFDDRDFHFLLKEKDETWSAKNGFSDIVSNYNKLETYLPTFPSYYHLKGTFAITNPYAKEK